MIRKKIKSTPISIFLAALFLVALGFVSWKLFQEQGPHGGAVKKTDNYYIEMKNPDKKIYAFLLDKKLKSINSKGISGDVKLFFRDSTTLDVKLKPSMGDTFTCESALEFYACKITFNVFGKEVSAKFDIPEQVVQTH